VPAREGHGQRRVSIALRLSAFTSASPPRERFDESFADALSQVVTAATAAR
jgi:hypothetical protein